MHNTQREFIGAGYYCLEIGPTVQGVLYKTLSNLDLGSDVTIIDGNQRVVFSPDLSRLVENYLKKLIFNSFFRIKK